MRVGGSNLGFERMMFFSSHCPYGDYVMGGPLARNYHTKENLTVLRTMLS